MALNVEQIEDRTVGYRKSNRHSADAGVEVFVYTEASGPGPLKNGDRRCRGIVSQSCEYTDHPQSRGATNPMCELFAMSSRRPATVNFSLDALAKHGSSTGLNKDGWGVGYYEDNDVRLIREAAAAGQSDWVRFIEAHDLRSRLVISHIRRATVGEPALRNTQPFCRELGGRMHLFAHNGNLREIAESPRLHFGAHRPIGETDSEYAFCALLARLENLWLSGDAGPTLMDRFEVVREFAAELRSLGPANFLYADGDILFAHGHRRRHADDAIRPPGLCLLRRHCPTDSPALVAEGAKVIANGQDVVLVASVPLTDEAWRPLADGEVVAVRDATIVCRAQP